MDDSETAELVASLRSTIANATREQESLKQKITLIESEKEREVCLLIYKSFYLLFLYLVLIIACIGLRKAKALR